MTSRMCLWMVGMTLLPHLGMLLSTSRDTNSTSAPMDVAIGLELIVNVTLKLGCAGFAIYAMF